MGWCSGNHSYAKVVEKEGPRKGALLPVGKWAKVVIFECQGKVQDWGIAGKALARMMGARGMISINPFTNYKGVFFVDSVERAEWFQERGRLVLRGGTVFCLRKWSPIENTVVLGKFRKGWIELRGLPFHLWDENQLKFIMKNWGKVTEVDWDTLKLVDLSKVKLKVEMNLNVMLPTLLEVIDGAWVFTVATSVIRGEGEGLQRRTKLTHCRS